MALRIRLGRTPERVTGHPLTAETGYRPGLTEADYWSRGRGIWVLKPGNVFTERELHITSPDDRILAVGDILGVRRYGDRFAVEGALRPGDVRVGTQICVPHESRNPISYAPDEEALWTGSRAHAAAVLAAALHDLANAWVRDHDVTAALLDRSGTWRTITGDWTNDTFYRELGYVLSLAIDDLGDHDEVRAELPTLAADRAACAGLLASLGPDSVDALLESWSGTDPSTGMPLPVRFSRPEYDDLFGIAEDVATPGCGLFGDDLPEAPHSPSQPHIMLHGKHGHTGNLIAVDEDASHVWVYRTQIDLADAQQVARSAVARARQAGRPFHHSDLAGDLPTHRM